MKTLALWPLSGVVWGLTAHLLENRGLRARARLTSNPEDSVSRARVLRAFVRRSVTHAGLRLTDPRPWLRDSPLDTLDSGRGFCGEVSRVLVRLLRLDGLDARRIYLRRSSDDHHVSTELIVHGKRYILDPQRGRPFVAPYISYLKASGMRFRGYWSPRLLPSDSRWARRFQHYRPPAAYTTLTESPHLMVAAASFLLTLALAAIAGGTP